MSLPSRCQHPGDVALLRPGMVMVCREGLSAVFLLALSLRDSPEQPRTQFVTYFPPQLERHEGPSLSSVRGMALHLGFHTWLTRILSPLFANCPCFHRPWNWRQSLSSKEGRSAEVTAQCRFCLHPFLTASLRGPSRCLRRPLLNRSE